MLGTNRTGKECLRDTIEITEIKIFSENKNKCIKDRSEDITPHATQKKADFKNL